MFEKYIIDAYIGLFFLLKPINNVRLTISNDDTAIAPYILKV